MKKIGIAIDRWKLKIFKKHLKEAGFQFEINPGISPGTLLLTVETDDIAHLHSTVQATNNYCVRQKMH